MGGGEDVVLLSYSTVLRGTHHGPQAQTQLLVTSKSNKSYTQVKLQLMKLVTECLAMNQSRLFMDRG